ncbi:hypothetical protein A0K93_03210 [Corynebacterium sp. BCW_4722]|nr:hypothetical protein A0K93_03210 [Corynebacterium sp. BCW_4722]
MAAIFKTVSWEVNQLVSGVKQGSISLPDLQRPFVWPATKVRDLFDSMYKGYPVGALMFWDVSGKGETRAISDNAGVAASHQIVDGQQRLTSLYAATQGFQVQDENYKKKSIVISFNPFTERFEVRSAAIAKSPEWIEDISTVFRSGLRAGRAYFKRLTESGREISEDQELEIDERIRKLEDIGRYTFDVVHIQNDVGKSLVADIFVRINSEGVSLNASDYILTWLSVFWPEGRDEIERFAHFSRLTPEGASERFEQPVSWTPINPFLKVETSHVVRAMVAVGQNRARLTDAYSNLQAKNRSTGQVDSDKQARELQKLKDALPIVTNETNWTEFIRSIQTAGFRSHSGITSNLNLVYSYVIFLLGRTRFNVELAKLRKLVARWVFMFQLTGRYTGSSESQMQRDLDLFANLKDGDAEGFTRVVERTIQITLTGDFWQFNLPQLLTTSTPKLSPAYQCYLASLNILDADMFMLKEKVRDWMDPQLPTVKGTEGHHLFPRKYQEKILGITDTKVINQAANFAPTDWNTNVLISDRAPSDYWPELVERRAPDNETLRLQAYWHALPDGWHSMDYHEFLDARRALIAAVIRDAFAKLGSAGSNDEALLRQPTDTEAQAPALTLADLFEDNLLLAGDVLRPVDEDIRIDAEVTEAGTLLLSDGQEFDRFDEATRHLTEGNVPGDEFWLLSRDGGIATLAEVLAAGPRDPDISHLDDTTQ